MVRKIDHEFRRKSVLTATINKYIKAAAPVSSEDIADDFDLSSATIRNIFAELEDSGYLTHPYTSGGRIPTKKGYRYYVDFLVSGMQLLDDEKVQIARQYDKQCRELEDILDKTSEVISRVTHYTGIASFLERDDRFFYRGISSILNQPEFQDFEKFRMVIKMLEDREELLGIINRDFTDRVKVYIGEESGCNAMEDCSLAVSSYCVKNKPSGRLAVLGPMRMEYEHIIPALEYISDILTDTLK